MYIKHNGEWVQPTPFIKNGGEWKKAYPYRKTNAQGRYWQYVGGSRNFGFTMKIGKYGKDTMSDLVKHYGFYDTVDLAYPKIEEGKINPDNINGVKIVEAWFDHQKFSLRLIDKPMDQINRAYVGIRFEDGTIWHGISLGSGPQWSFQAMYDQKGNRTQFTEIIKDKVGQQVDIVFADRDLGVKGFDNYDNYEMKLQDCSSTIVSSGTIYKYGWIGYSKDNKDAYLNPTYYRFFKPIKSFGFTSHNRIILSGLMYAPTQAYATIEMNGVKTTHELTPSFSATYPFTKHSEVIPGLYDYFKNKLGETIEFKLLPLDLMSLKKDSFVINVGNQGNAYYGFDTLLVNTGKIVTKKPDREINSCVGSEILGKKTGEISWKTDIFAGIYEIRVDNKSFGRGNTRYDRSKDITRLKIDSANEGAFLDYLKSKEGQDVTVTIVKVGVE